MSIKLDGTLFKFEACLCNTMMAFEFFKLKIYKLPRLNEVERKLLCILSSRAVFRSVFHVRSTKKTAQNEYPKGYTISFWHLCLMP